MPCVCSALRKIQLPYVLVRLVPIQHVKQHIICYIKVIAKTLSVSHAPNAIKHKQQGQ